NVLVQKCIGLLAGLRFIDNQCQIDDPDALLSRGRRRERKHQSQHHTDNNDSLAHPSPFPLFSAAETPRSARIPRRRPPLPVRRVSHQPFRKFSSVSAVATNTAFSVPGTTPPAKTAGENKTSQQRRAGRVRQNAARSRNYNVSPSPAAWASSGKPHGMGRHSKSVRRALTDHAALVRKSSTETGWSSPLYGYAPPWSMCSAHSIRAVRG